MAGLHLVLLSLVVAILCTGTLAQSPTCGYEGQQPCADGCVADDLPSEEDASDWYPQFDNFVPAPSGYRVEEGLCTRCGHIYEPVCMRDGISICLVDPHAGIIMEPGSDGYCLPPTDIFGCGTTGQAPCPNDVVADFGTLAVLSAEDQGWKLTASIGEIRDEGCLFSLHNLALRFVKAPESWLPEGHKCANVCIPCGTIGYPECLSEPRCSRRADYANPSRFRDGPTFIENGLCMALNCGASTTLSDLDPCTSTLGTDLLEFVSAQDDPEPGFEEPLDSDGDGCAEPYQLSNGVCTDPMEPSDEPAPLRRREFACSREGMRLIDANTIAGVRELLAEIGTDSAAAVSLNERLLPILQNEGRCVECGRENDLPCVGMDFDGCNVSEGFIYNVDLGICIRSPCGGGTALEDGNAFFPPFNSDECPQGIPEFYDDDPSEAPINPRTNCLFFHNLVVIEDGDFAGRESCEPCGFPGARCLEECVMAIAYEPSHNGGAGLGHFQFLDDAVRTGGSEEEHCVPFVPEAIDASCDTTLESLTDPDATDAPVHSPLVTPTSDDPDFGTTVNPNPCHHDPITITHVYETECPGDQGGTPVSRWHQCGGLDYDGPTCCFGFAVCVRKSPFFSVCEPANVPPELIPWHQLCGSGHTGTCEVGSICEEDELGLSYCRPETHHIVGAATVTTSGGFGSSATLGVIIGAIAIHVATCAIAYVMGRRRGLAQGGYKLNRPGGWNDSDLVDTTNSVKGADSRTYLDLAAATEAEALAHRLRHGGNDLDSSATLHLPTSDFGIGRRA